MLLKYDDTANAKHITTNMLLYNNDIEISSNSYDNSDYIGNSNTDILLNNAFYYTFDGDVNNLKRIISFTKRRSYVNLRYSSVNANRLVIKHYGV